MTRQDFVKKTVRKLDTEAIACRDWARGIDRSGDYADESVLFYAYRAQQKRLTENYDYENFVAQRA